MILDRECNTYIARQLLLDQLWFGLIALFYLSGKMSLTHSISRIRNRLPQNLNAKPKCRASRSEDNPTPSALVSGELNPRRPKGSSRSAKRGDRQGVFQPAVEF